MWKVALLGLFSGWLALACSSEPGPEPDLVIEPLPKPELATVDEATATFGADGALGVTFAGRVGNGPVRVVEVELLDDEGQPFHTFSGWFPYLDRPNRFATTASVAYLEADADNFRGFTTQVDTSLTVSPRRVRVKLGERSELMGEPFEVKVAAASASKVVEPGAPCDPFEVVNRCGEGAWCDVPDVEALDSARCVEPVEDCPFELPTLESTYEGSNFESPDRTLASCTNSRGNVGSEQGHVFVAPAAGTYRFTAESVMAGSNAALTLFVRSHCQYAIAKAELGCVHQLDSTTDKTAVNLPSGPLTLDIPLTAAQKVYVFVEAWWVNGGDYTLSVQPLN